MALILGIALSISTLHAQVTSFEEFKTEFELLKATPGGGNVQIGAAFSINEPYTLSSTEENPVSIGTVDSPSTFVITVGENGLLTLGSHVSIYTTTGKVLTSTVGGHIAIEEGAEIISTATSPLTANGGNVIINGGTITSSNFPAVLAEANGSLVTINGGYVYTTSGASTSYPRAVNVTNNSDLVMNGGLVSADVVNGRGLNIQNGRITVNGGTVTANGTGARAIQADFDNGLVIVSGDAYIESEQADGIVTQKSARVVIKGGVINANRPLFLNSGTSRIYDFRKIELTANPEAGHYNQAQEVTLGTIETADASFTNSALGAVVRYSIDDAEIDESSTLFDAGFTLQVPAIIYALAEKDGYTSVVSTFEYTAPTVSVVDVSTTQPNIPTVIKENIDLRSIAGVRSVSLFNLSGSLTFYTENAGIINVSTLPKGLFIMQVATIDSVLTYKLIKQ